MMNPFRTQELFSPHEMNFIVRHSKLLSYNSFYPVKTQKKKINKKTHTPFFRVWVL